MAGLLIQQQVHQASGSPKSKPIGFGSGLLNGKNLNLAMVVFGEARLNPTLERKSIEK
jgi:hypothetical protein